MNEFKVNQKIEIIADDGKRISTIIHDIDSDKVYISVMASDLRVKILRPGDEINGILYCDDKLLAFTATITDRIAGDIPLYEFSNIANLSRAQRRKDVRVACSIDMKYSYNKYLLNRDYKDLKTDRTMEEIDKYLKDGMILDISAGGARIYINEDLEVGKDLLLTFSLKTSLLEKVTIVYKEINMLPNKTTYFYGVKFKDIGDKEREQIISHVFLLMRKNRIK